VIFPAFFSVVVAFFPLCPKLPRQGDPVELDGLSMCMAVEKLLNTILMLGALQGIPGSQHENRGGSFKEIELNRLR